MNKLTKKSVVAKLREKYQRMWNLYDAAAIAHKQCLNNRNNRTKNWDVVVQPYLVALKTYNDTQRLFEDELFFYIGLFGEGIRNEVYK